MLTPSPLTREITSWSTGVEDVTLYPTSRRISARGSELLSVSARAEMAASMSPVVASTAARASPSTCMTLKNLSCIRPYARCRASTSAGSKESRAAPLLADASESGRTSASAA
eukprot:scaffold7624_cov248-Pinguiococcus_pyrenoidosus.AAC.8